MTKCKPKKFYTRDYASKLDELEARRVAGKITCEQWVMRAEMDRRTFQRIRTRGRAFPHQIRQLSYALRSLMREHKNQHMLELIDEN